MAQTAAAVDSSWYERVKDELVANTPYRKNEYFKRFADGRLARDEAWTHVAQAFLIVDYFPRMFSGIHSRCDDLQIRKECAKHLLVEDLGYFQGKVGGTPDHLELYKRIGDDMGYPREAWDTITPLPETRAIVDYLRRLAHEIPWTAALCATSYIETTAVELARTVGKGLVEHYGCKPGWGGMNYVVHEQVELEESGDTEEVLLGMIATPEDRATAERVMRDLHQLIVNYGNALDRLYVKN